MKMQCTVKPNDRLFTIELSAKEAERLSRLMNLIDPHTLAISMAISMVGIEGDFNDHITGEMTEAEVRNLFVAHNANMTDAMHDYGQIVLMIEQLKRLDKM